MLPQSNARTVRSHGNQLKQVRDKMQSDQEEGGDNENNPSQAVLYRRV